LSLHDHDTEAACLGAMLMSQVALDAVIDTGITATDFHAPAHNIIFAAIERCSKAGDVDEALVVADLSGRTVKRKDGSGSLLDDARGADYIRRLPSLVPVVLNAKRYAGTVIELAERRRLAQVCKDIQARAEAPDGASIGDLVAEAASLVSSVESESASTGFVSLDVEARRLYDEQWGTTERRPTGISSGFKRFDEVAGGLRPGTLTIVAARPAMGKSAWLTNVLDNIVSGGRNVALFSLEMGPAEIAGRVISRRSGIGNKLLSYHQLGPDARKQVGDSVADYEINHPGRFLISDAPGLSHQKLRALARSLDKGLRLSGEGGLACIGVDYLQLATAPEMSRGNREAEVAKVSRELKALSRELQVPVIALAQLSRALESRPDKRPQLSDLRESGAIEQDADLVGFLYRHEYYHPDDANSRGLAELIVGKNRGGDIGTVHLGWRAAYTAFVDLADAHRPASYVAGTGAVA